MSGSNIGVPTVVVLMLLMVGVFVAIFLLSTPLIPDNRCLDLSKLSNESQTFDHGEKPGGKTTSSLVNKLTRTTVHGVSKLEQKTTKKHEKLVSKEISTSERSATTENIVNTPKTTKHLNKGKLQDQ